MKLISDCDHSSTSLEGYHLNCLPSAASVWNTRVEQLLRNKKLLYEVSYKLMPMVWLNFDKNLSRAQDGCKLLQHVDNRSQKKYYICIHIYLVLVCQVWDTMVKNTFPRDHIRAPYTLISCCVLTWSDLLRTTRILESYAFTAFIAWWNSSEISNLWASNSKMIRSTLSANHAKTCKELRNKMLSQTIYSNHYYSTIDFVDLYNTKRGVSVRLKLESHNEVNLLQQAYFIKLISSVNSLLLSRQNTRGVNDSDAVQDLIIHLRALQSR